jgi:hypothetical protein
VKRSLVRETYAVKKVGKRYAVVRTTKVSRVLELVVRLSTHASRLDATIRLREMGVA